MIIVYLSQQMGNQMFQYALGKQLEMLGKDVKFTLRYFDRHPEHEFVLPRIFNLQLLVATEAEVQAEWDIRSRFFYRVNKKVFGWDPLLTEDYYSPAMDYFKEKYGDVHFYVFSNDLDWCREHLKAERITYVDWNTGADSPFDMWLMTQCKHNIIANSTFSWWGAWLNGNEGKEVVAPRTWDFYFKDHPDLYCPDWILF